MNRILKLLGFIFATATLICLGHFLRVMVKKVDSSMEVLGAGSARFLDQSNLELNKIDQLQLVRDRKSEASNLDLKLINSAGKNIDFEHNKKGNSGTPYNYALRNDGPGFNSLTTLELSNRNRIVSLFKQKKYLNALELADSIKTTSNKNLREWIDLQYPVLLTAAGWGLIEIGNYPKAHSMFIEALNLRDERDAKRGLVFCAYKMGEYDAVLKLSDDLLAHGKDDLLIKKIRTEVLESEGRIEEARFLYKAGDERQKAIGKKIDLAKNQIQLRNNHFQLTVDYRADQEKVDAVLHFLEDCLVEYQDFGFLLPSRLIEVILYREDEFMGLVAGQPIWAEGLFDGKMRIPISSGWSSPYADARFATVLRHELSHALLHEQGGSIPAVIDEGIAQRMACRKTGCLALNGGTKFQQKAVFEGSFIGLSQDNARLAYKQSLYFIYFMETRFGADSFQELVESATIGGNSNDIIYRALGEKWDIVYQEAASSYEHGRTVKP